MRHKTIILISMLITLTLFQNCGEGFSVNDASFQNKTGEQFCDEFPQDKACITYCTFDDQTLMNGESIEAFRESTVPIGEPCESERRSCNSNGHLSGSYQFSYCAVARPKACLFNGKTLLDGESTEAFLNSTEPVGGECSREIRVCNDGILSGSAKYETCLKQLPKKRFKTVWIEPHSVSPGVVSRDFPITKQKIHQIFKNYNHMGVDKVVVAYSELLEYYFYTPSATMKSQHQAVLDARGEVKKTLHSPQLIDGKPLLNHLFEAADNTNIKLIVGLSDFDNKKTIFSITDALRRNDKIQLAKANIDLTTQVTLTKMMADDIYSKFKHHKSFYGWYLIQEPHCLDVSMNYFEPIVQHLRLLDSKKITMISPNADAEVCFQYKANNSAQLINGYKNYLKIMKSKGIDIIAYQDSVGAAYQAGSNQFFSYSGDLLSLHNRNSLNGTGKYHFTDRARNLRINYLKTIVLPSLKLAHQGTGVEFWMNTELWRMDGNCLQKTNIYGCNFSSNSFSKQLDTWFSFTNELMLNEGFMQFDFKNAPITLSNKGNLLNKPARENTTKFTKDYLEYLKVDLTNQVIDKTVIDLE